MGTVVAVPSAAAAVRSWPFRGLVTTVLVVYLATGALLGGALAIGRLNGIWLATFTRDPTQTAGVPFYVGFLSNVGVLLLAFAAAVCLFTALVLRPQRERREDSAFLAAFGTITLVLLLDDLFMVHDEIFPKYVGIGEFLPTGVYALMLAVCFVRFGHQILAPEGLLLVSALALFGVSLVTEHVDVYPLNTVLAEDGSKLFGLANWLAYAVTISLHRARLKSMQPSGWGERVG